jgi:DNA-binding PadR family transcriptional regulator
MNALEAVLLRVIARKPCSGYDLRRSDGLGAFSDSPGSVYPALKRLEETGLVESTVEPGGRHRTVYRLTNHGRAALHTWVTASVTPADLERRPELLELRYLFLGEQNDTAGLARFLVEYADAVASRIREHEKRVRGASLCERQVARLTMDLLLARHTWAMRALQDLKGVSVEAVQPIAIAPRRPRSLPAVAAPRRSR